MIDAETQTIESACSLEGDPRHGLSLTAPDCAETSGRVNGRRGRIVYERPADLFVIYADGRLRNPAKIKLIVEAFRLPSQRFVVRSDDHYR
jgi:hypothetical protein